MNRLKWLLVALALCTAGVANAQTTWYIGGDIARVTTKVDDKTGLNTTGTAEATTLRLKSGAHVLPWLDLELQVAFPRSETYSRTAGTTNQVSSATTAFFARPHHQLGAFDLYLLAGFSSTIHEFKGTFEGKERAAGFAYGVGAQYKVTPKVGISLEWTQYAKDNLPVANAGGGIDTDTRAVGVGLNYTF